MRTRFFSILTILFLSLFSLSSVFAQTLPQVTLPELTLPDGVTAQIGTGKITGNVAVSPNGSHIAVPSLTNIWIYNSTGTAVDILIGHTDQVTDVAFSPDGTKIASVGWDKTVRVWTWNGSTGVIQHILTHTDYVTSVAFQPDTNTVASGSGDGSIRFWNATTGANQHTLAAHAGRVNGLAFSQDGDKLVSGSYDETIGVWDMSNSAGPSLLRTLTGHTDSIQSVAFHPDGKIIASGSWDATARLWNVNTGISLPLIGHTYLIKSVAFSDGGTLLATGSSDRSIRTWNVGTGAPAQTFTGHNLAVTSVTFDASDIIISGSADATVRRWPTGESNISPFRPGSILVRHTGAILGLAYDPDGNRLVTGSSDGTVRLWDTATAQQLKIVRETSTSIPSVAIELDSSGATTIASVGEWDTSVNLSYPGGSAPIDVVVNGSSILSMALSPDANTLAVGLYGGSLGLANIQPSPITFTISPGVGTLGVTFSADGTQLASGGESGHIYWITGINGPSVLRTLSGHTGVITDVAFSPDGTKIASASFDHTIRLWDIATRTRDNTLIRPVPVDRTLIGHRGTVKSVAFSPDGTKLVSGGVDSTVILWNVSTGSALTSLIAHAGPVQSVAFNPNGNEFATGSEDGTVLLWNINNVPLAPQLVSQFPEPQGLLNPDSVVTATALLANYPNPFNPETWIPYQLASPADVRISIYSTEGILVRTLDLGAQDVGVYQSRARAAYWDGKNQAGEPVASGVYFYTLTAGEFTATRKMLILK